MCINAIDTCINLLASFTCIVYTAADELNFFQLIKFIKYYVYSVLTCIECKIVGGEKFHMKIAKF